MAKYFRQYSNLSQAITEVSFVSLQNSYPKLRFTFLIHIRHSSVEQMKNKTHLYDGFSLREKALMMFLMKLSLVLNNGLIISQGKYSTITRLWKFLTLSSSILQFKFIFLGYTYTIYPIITAFQNAHKLSPIRGKFGFVLFVSDKRKELQPCIKIAVLFMGHQGLEPQTIRL